MRRTRCATRRTLSDGVNPMPVRMRRDPRARKMRLRIDGMGDQALLTVPPGTPERAAERFLCQNRDWLAAERARLGQRVRLVPGAHFPLRGETTAIGHDPALGRRVEERDGEVVAGGPPEFAEARLIGWLKDRARIELEAASRRYADRLGLTLDSVGVREMRSRWGSASSNRRLRFSWRLILAPRPIADYVAAHEVAHLVELNHSPAFWAVVERLYGAHAAARRWLRQDGPGLLRVGPPLARGSAGQDPSG